MGAYVETETQHTLASRAAADSSQSAADHVAAHFAPARAAGARGQDLSRSALAADEVGSAHREPGLRRTDPVRVLAAALCIIVALALGVMVAISAFDHSYADDWHYGVDAHLALEAGEGLSGAVAAALQQTLDTFESWQGTYSAIFLMSLQPGVFSESLYGLGAVSIIAVLVLATGYAVGVAVRDVAGGDRSSWLVLTCLVLFLQTQLVPSPVEAFWWYNSAIYYTFYHSLMLFGAGLVVRLLRGRTRRGPLTAGGTAARTLVLCALAFVVAGGNFVTGIVCVLALLAVTVAGIVRVRTRALVLVPALAIMVCGFACSMAAPGNAERQVTQFPGDGAGVVGTIVRSALAGFEYSVLWINGLLVVALLLAVPVFWRLARRNAYSYRLPALPVLVMLTLFMASFTPTFFSMGNVGPGRVQNIRYDLFVMAAMLCAGWLVGWVARRWERLHGVARAEDGRPLGAAYADLVLKRETGHSVSAPHPARALGAYFGAVVLTLVLVLAALAVDERHRDDLTSISAAASLISGEAADYDEQVRARLSYLEETPESQVEVAYYTAGPRVLFMGDIRDNMDNYINFRLAQWYGKDSVIGYNPNLR